eukprot:366472-Chlamydomonas_euryale.AAC.9
MRIGGIGDSKNCVFMFSQDYRDGLRQTCPKACPAEHADPLLDAVQLDAAQLPSAAARWLRHHQPPHHLLVPHHHLQSQVPALRLCTV